jgi:uncharacterized protein YodC (DUF2158 family)
MSKPIITDARPVFRIGDRVTVKETGEHMMVIGLDDQACGLNARAYASGFKKHTGITRLGSDIGVVRLSNPKLTHGR